MPEAKGSCGAPSEAAAAPTDSAPVRDGSQPGAYECICRPAPRPVQPHSPACVYHNLPRRKQDANGTSRQDGA